MRNVISLDIPFGFSMKKMFASGLLSGKLISKSRKKKQKKNSPLSSLKYYSIPRSMKIDAIVSREDPKRNILVILLRVSYSRRISSTIVQTRRSTTSSIRRSRSTSPSYGTRVSIPISVSSIVSVCIFKR